MVRVGMLAGLALLLGASAASAQGAQAPDARAAIIAQTPAALPADAAFGRFIALIRGHLLAGEALVAERDWRDALPHFNFPHEEIYGVIRSELRTYKTPAFDGALKALAYTVKTRNLRQYPKALKKVENALDAADANLKTRQPDWPGFTLTVAITVLKTAAEEYDEAVSKGRIVHPVGYRTARGFVLQADRMIEEVADGLESRNPSALFELREVLAQLKQALAAVNAPKQPSIDVAAFTDLATKAELAAPELR